MRRSDQPTAVTEIRVFSLENTTCFFTAPKTQHQHYHDTELKLFLKTLWNIIGMLLNWLPQFHFVIIYIRVLFNFILFLSSYFCFSLVFSCSSILFLLVFFDCVFLFSFPFWLFLVLVLFALVNEFCDSVNFFGIQLLLTKGLGLLIVRLILFVYLIVRSFARFVHLVLCLFVRLFLYLFICSSRFVVCLFVCSFVCFFVRSFVCLLFVWFAWNFTCQTFCVFE